MGYLKTEENPVKRKRLNMAELAEIHERAPMPQKIVSVRRSFHLVSIKSLTIKPWIYVSKAEALGVPESILALVAQCPKWGPKKLADSLLLEGRSLSRSSIYNFLVKHNLNHLSLRKEWQGNQKETKS